MAVKMEFMRVWGNLIGTVNHLNCPKDAELVTRGGMWETKTNPKSRLSTVNLGVHSRSSGEWGEVLGFIMLHTYASRAPVHPVW